MVRIGAFRVFMRTRRNIEPSSPLKPNQVGFIFIGPNSLSRAEDFSAVNHVTQACRQSWLKIRLKVGFKKLRLEPKFLNRWLWFQRLKDYNLYSFTFVILFKLYKLLESYRTVEQDFDAWTQSHKSKEKLLLFYYCYLGFLLLHWKTICFKTTSDTNNITKM